MASEHGSPGKAGAEQAQCSKVCQMTKPGADAAASRHDEKVVHAGLIDGLAAYR
jgi:hypothetical protein